MLAEKVDVVLPASSLRGGSTEVVREIEACVEDLGRSARPRMPPPAVFDVAECQKIGRMCYYELAEMSSIVFH
jgi:hypothetical protein